MSGTKPSQSRSGENLDADGYHVEERAESEEYHQSKDVREDEDRTEIHVREGKVVKLEEVKTKETIRLASDDEVIALTFADFEGLDEIEAGREITVEEFNRKESRHEKTVFGEPVIEISMSEERKSEEVKEDPQWKKDLSLFPDSENGKDSNISGEFGRGPVAETYVVSAQSTSFAVPAVATASNSGALALSASGSADADVSVLRDPKDVEMETSAHGKSKRLDGLFGKKKQGKDKNKGKHSPTAAAVVAMEVETDGVDKENEVHDLSASRRHEIKHKRHIIEEVVIEDSDKFYEKQEKRPKLFLKGTLERKKESPMETSHEAAAIETGSVELKPPNQSIHAESLPNISAENVTYVVDYDQQASGSMDVEGHGDKPLAEYKWYSFPRKRATGKTPESASKTLQKQPKTKSQEEVVIFDAQEVDKTDRKWGLKFGKWTGQTAPISETVSTEQVTFVVENEPPAVATSTVHDLPVTSAETHTFSVKGEKVKPNISGLPHHGKVTVKGKHDVEANVEPETVTFVVEQDLPEKDVSLNKDEEHSLGLMGKIGGLFHDKGTSKTSLDGETVTYVVQTDLPKAEVEIDKDKESSLGLSGKFGAHRPDKDTIKAHGEPETLTFVVEQDMPKAKVELNKGKEHSGSKPSVESETVKFVVEQDLPKAEVELQKDKERSWGLLGKTGSQHPEKHTSKPTEESETVIFVIEQDLPKAKVKVDKEKEHSLSLPGKFRKETSKPDDSQVQVNIGARPKQQEVVVDDPHQYTEKNPIGKKGEAELQVQGSLPVEESLTITVQGEGDPGKVSLSSDDDKGKKSWSLKWPTGEKKDKKEKKEKEKKRKFQDEVIVDDTHLHMDEGKITVKQGFGKLPKDSPRAEVRFDANIEQPQGTTVDISTPKKPDKLQLEGEESVTFIVEEKLPEAKLEFDGEQGSWHPPERVHSEKYAINENIQPEVVTFIVEQDLPKVKVEHDKEKEHSWSLTGKTSGGQLPKKETSKPSAESEKVTFVVEQDLPKADVKLDKEKEHSWSFQGIFGSQKPEKDTSKPSGDSETVTFVVEQDLPKADVKLDKEKEHSWSLTGKTSGGHLPKKDASKPSADSEKVTFVVEQDLSRAEVKLDKEKEHTWSFPGIFGSKSPEKDTNKPDIGPESVTFVVEQEVPKVETERSKEKHLSFGPIGKIEGSSPGKHKSKTISQPQPETVTFVIEQDMPEAKVELDVDKDHSKSRLGKFGNLFPEKTSSKTSLEPESVTFVVEGQPITGGEGSISVGKPEFSVEGKKHKQKEHIIDDPHQFTDESDIKLKAPKITDIVRKKELKTPTQAESITFFVTGEPEVTADLPNVSLTANGDEGKAIRPTQETVTFVVKGEEPTVGEIKTDITCEKPRAEKSWKLPKWPPRDKKEEGDDGTRVRETRTFVVQTTGPEDAAKRDDYERERPVLFDKKVELKPISGTVSAGHKPKDTKQEEVIVDDTHLYSYKSELRWSPVVKAGGKSKTGARPSAGVEQPEVKLSADAGPATTQETVTYTITTEDVPPDQDLSSGTDKAKGGKPHKWKLFGKKSPKGSVQSGSSISLPSSDGSKDTSLPRRKHQEEMVVGSDKDFVPDSHGIITTGKRKPGAKKGKDAGTIDTTVYTFKVEPGVTTESVDIPKVQTQHEVKVAVPDLRAEIQTPAQPEVRVAVPDVQADIQTSDRWVIVSSEAETAATKPVGQLKFDLGDVKAVENVKQEYLESPETKKIVRTLKYDDESRAEFHVNGFQGVRSTDHVEDSEVGEKRVSINFGTSTPKKDVSTGAHGDEIRGPGSDHPFDVTVSSDTSISFVPQVSGGGYGGLDGSFEGSSVTGSRPSSFYYAPATAGRSGPPPPQHFVVIAIDFGTTFSGYAFSFSRDINSIHVMRKWPDGDPGVVNMKTPTVLLLTPEGKFHSFGFTAKDFYHNLNPKEATKWLYFEKFKMALHYSADLSTGTELEASNGQRFPALSVFSHALRYFRDHALREVSDQSATRILNEDVRWVITVPAIWKAPAKQFMRQAAYQAGIASEDNPDQLLVALEPEAASVFIRKQRLQQLIPESELIAERSVSPVSKRETTPEPVLVDRVSHLYGKQDTNRWSQTLPADALSLSFQRAPSPIYQQVRVGEDFDLAGMRYMVADCGGGTVDITVYELSAETGKLAELYKATGGPYGSMGVDLEFEALLVEIFGADFIDVFKAKRPAGWVDLMMAFESRKRAATPYKSKPLNVPLPFSFMDYHKKHRNNTVESAIRKYNNKDVRWSSQGMMRLMPEAMDRLFKPTLSKIKEAIGQVLNNPDVKGIKYIFLVGGFAESQMLQQEIRNEFSHLIKILIPADASLAILKGAVCFGCDPGVVTIRKSRMSYGLSVLNKFIRGRHPESKLAYKDGVEWCVDVFDPLVLANQSCALGSSVVRSYTPAGPGQKFGNFEMYCSERDDVQFITDPGVEKEVRGQLRLDLSQLDQSATGGKRREVQARLTFGDTEIKVVALDVATGNSVRATIDFLNK